METRTIKSYDKEGNGWLLTEHHADDALVHDFLKLVSEDEHFVRWASFKGCGTWRYREDIQCKAIAQDVLGNYSCLTMDDRVLQIFESEVDNSAVDTVDVK
jgi:hypothetical protein